MGNYISKRDMIFLYLIHDIHRNMETTCAHMTQLFVVNYLVSYIDFLDYQFIQMKLI